MALKELAQLLHRVGVDAVGAQARAADGLDQRAALVETARGDYHLGEYFGILGTLVGHDCSDAAGADDDDFCHYCCIGLCVLLLLRAGRFDVAAITMKVIMPKRMLNTVETAMTVLANVAPCICGTA